MELYKSSEFLKYHSHYLILSGLTMVGNSHSRIRETIALTGLKGRVFSKNRSPTIIDIYIYIYIYIYVIYIHVHIYT